MHILFLEVDKEDNFFFFFFKKEHFNSVSTFQYIESDTI